MRHLKSGRQLGRNSSHRKAMFRNMVVSLLDHESITTTDSKAKELRKFAERVITLGKKGSLNDRRRARLMVNDRDVLQKLFTTLAERYKERPGGYTRIVKLGLRPGDKAPLSVIQLVQEEVNVKEKTKKKAKTTKAKEAEKVTKKAAEVKETVESKQPEEKAQADTESPSAESVKDEAIETKESEAEEVEAKETPEAEKSQPAEEKTKDADKEK
jgi:large subunit ribosomal protein L17